MRYGVCACGTVFGLGSLSSVSCTCMRVCTSVGVCSPSVVQLVVSTVYACVYGVRHLRAEWCTCCAEVQVHVFAQCSACATLAVHLSCVHRTCSPTARECAGVACTLCVFMYSVRHGHFEQCV